MAYEPEQHESQCDSRTEPEDPTSTASDLAWDWLGVRLEASEGTPHASVACLTGARQSMSIYDQLKLSPVEARAIENSPLDPLYAPDEQIPVITVSNFPALGQLVAMRFVEWVQDHPGGVISLPTGKTPEHFIKWVNRLVQTWDDPATRELLEKNGVDPARRPDMRSLHFVQIDEFYPIQPTQKNSFYHYVKKYYLEGMGLDPAQSPADELPGDRHRVRSRISRRSGPTRRWTCPCARGRLSTDLERMQQDVLSRIDDWCQRREEQIRALGGLGFFLGGIGPDGHIGFNIRGSDHFSTTRLMATNYETQAAAAGDLGGIEVSRQRLVITIGLGTITCNPDCTAIIIAAGEAKAGVIADAVQGPVSIRIPASALRTLPNARFYITLGAAKQLRRRQASLLVRSKDYSDEQVMRAVVDLSLQRNKPLLDLTEQEAQQDPMLSEVLKGRTEPFPELVRLVRERLIQTYRTRQRHLHNTRFLHTEPHHDDLMLGYLPHIVRNMRNPTNDHHFVTLTSGFTAVTNQFMLRAAQGTGTLDPLARVPGACAGKATSTPTTSRAAIATSGSTWTASPHATKRCAPRARRRRLLRNLMEVYEESDLAAIADRMTELQHYFGSVYPGRKDPGAMQRLKGMCREWEAETLWGYFGWQCSHIRHLRLGFYTGDIFVPEPTVERDVAPVLALLERGQARCDLLCARSRGQRPRHALQSAAGDQRGDRPLRRTSTSGRTCASGDIATSGSGSIPARRTCTCRCR